MEKKYLTVREVGEELRISVNTVNRWIHEKKIPAKRYGRQWRIPYDAVSNWLENGEIERNADKFWNDEERPKEGRFSLQGIFEGAGPIPEGDGIVKLFPRQGEWTEEDYFRLPETNRIVELSKGRLIITPSPTTEHQIISLNLSLLIATHVKLNKLGTVCYSPLDVRLFEGTIRQPDIVFMRNEHKDRITEKYWGVPDLVMEITSESTEKQDRTDKFSEYEKAGISEYWVVDPSEQTIEVFALENEAYVLLGKWGIGETAKSKLLTGFEVKVDELME